MEELKERVEVLDQGRITIPKNIREKLGIRAGSILEVYIKGKAIIMEVLVK
jgi:AbrB family looped-hinge helix DNA binding protein